MKTPRSRFHSLTSNAIMLVVLALAAEARATTRTVTNLNDRGSGSLRDTIASAGDGDEIVFAANVRGTITLTSGQVERGQTHRDRRAGCERIDDRAQRCERHAAFRIFSVTADDSDNVGIADLTLAGGLLTDAFGDGGCIYNDAARLNLRTCHIRDNRASKNGGAIYNDAAASGRFAKIELDGCTFSGNYAGESGGAIYTNGSNSGEALIELYNCTYTATMPAFRPVLFTRLRLRTGSRRQYFTVRRWWKTSAEVRPPAPA